jgi:hypothetical protein
MTAGCVHTNIRSSALSKKLALGILFSDLQSKCTHKALL